MVGPNVTEMTANVIMKVHISLQLLAPGEKSYTREGRKFGIEKI
jgi:hypothetical protein